MRVDLIINFDKSKDNLILSAEEARALFNTLKLIFDPPLGVFNPGILGQPQTYQGGFAGNKVPNLADYATQNAQKCCDDGK